MLSERIVDYDGLFVYHGSSLEIKTIDLSQVKGAKDFGRGFYTTTLLGQARKFSKTVCRRCKLNESVATVTAFQITTLTNLKVQIFSEIEPPSIEWLDFVLECRKSYSTPHKFDVVIGPVADDQTGIVIQALQDGLYGDSESLSAKKRAIDLLETQNLGNQLTFCTARAISNLIQRGIV